MGSDAPGCTELWILDLESTRLLIAAERSASSLQKDLDDLRTIPDSIRIEP
ncbi:MAG TPA: hypothetical protein VJ948_02860 [Acidimicrobiia bacterium]|nr:hypothetical protein [Acidimicrobiia bacterium]